jgi:hypothetical protein
MGLLKTVILRRRDSGLHERPELQPRGEHDLFQEHCGWNFDHGNRLE